MFTQRQLRARANTRDRYQTPRWPIEMLIQYLPPGLRVWECCAGEGQLAGVLEEHGFSVTSTDILAGHDFLWDPELHPDTYDIIITNPPFSVKNAFIDRIVGMGKPYALLLSLSALEARDRQGAWAMSNMQLVMLPKRVHYDFPSEADAGQESKANFPSAWFTSGLRIPNGCVFADAPKLPRQRVIAEKNEQLVHMRAGSMALLRGCPGPPIPMGNPPAFPLPMGDPPALADDLAMWLEAPGDGVLDEDLAVWLAGDLLGT